MTVHKRITGCLTAAGLLALILDGETAFSGASAGIDLCLKTVIPSLFPFLFLCSILTNVLWGGQAKWMRKSGKKLGIPSGGESILIASILGGYPAGAQTVGAAYCSGTLTKQDAEHLLSFCNNAGPAFLFGMTATLFPDKTSVWALWIIQILSAALTAVAVGYTPEKPARFPVSPFSLSAILVQTVRIMGTICGWILLFRILTAFLEHWVLFPFPREIQVIITGILELSNGCCALSAIESVSLRFLVCTGFLSFGGLCVTMQTISVIGGLSAVSYLTGKLRQTFFSIILSILYLHLGWIVLAVFGIILWIYPAKEKKRSGFPATQGV